MTRKNWCIEREAKPVQKPQVDVARSQETDQLQHNLSFRLEHDPFAEFQSMDSQEGYADFDTFKGFQPHPVQEGNLYDLFENITQYYELQLPHSGAAQQYF